MSINLQYKYAQVRTATRKCVRVFTSTEEHTDTEDYVYVPIETLSDDYLGKYYIDGVWFEDAEGTIPYEG